MLRLNTHILYNIKAIQQLSRQRKSFHIYLIDADDKQNTPNLLTA